MTVRHFCTLFDSGFLSRGLALYDSLNTVYGEGFHLYVVAFDHDCESLSRYIKWNWMMALCVILPRQISMLLT